MLWIHFNNVIHETEQYIKCQQVETSTNYKRKSTRSILHL